MDIRVVFPTTNDKDSWSGIFALGVTYNLNREVIPEENQPYIAHLLGIWFIFYGILLTWVRLEETKAC
jgi:hypothetical protein